LRPGTKKILSAFFLFVAVCLVFRFLLPLVSPFLLGGALALAAEPMVSFLHRRGRIPRPVSTGIAVSMTVLLLAAVLLTLCAFLIRELGNLSGMLPDLEQTARSGLNLVQHWLLGLSAHTPEGIRPMVEENVNALFSDGSALVSRAGSWLLSFTGNLLSHVPDSALGLGTAMISAFLISAKLPRIRKWCLRRIPRQRLESGKNALRQLRGVLQGWFSAQAKLMGITFTVLLLGFVILRIPHALFWALGVCLVDAFPILGTGTVLIPWSFLSFLQDDIPRAFGIGSLYIVVTLTRSALEPKFLGHHLGLDPLITLMVMYAGFKLWGIGGMLLAPILTVTAIQLVPDKRKEDRL